VNRGKERYRLRVSDASGRKMLIARIFNKGIGGTRGGRRETTFREETTYRSNRRRPVVLSAIKGYGSKYNIAGSECFI